MSRVFVPGEVKGDAPIVDYNHIFEAEQDNTRLDEMEMWMAKRIGEHMTRVYPQRHWEVGVDLRGGMAVLKCPDLSLTHGYHLEIRRRTLHDLVELFAKAGGEILERHNVTRGRLRDRGIFDDMPVTLRGDVIAPDAKGVNPLKIVHH